MTIHVITYYMYVVLHNTINLGAISLNTAMRDTTAIFLTLLATRGSLSLHRESSFCSLDIWNTQITIHRDSVRQADRFLSGEMD